MSSSPHRVLCVEDDADFCEIVAYVLARVDCEVVTANSLTEARRKMTETTFDLYLIDQRLPDAEGIELCREVRASDPDVPILFCTGDARASMRAQALAAGATKFLTKPIDPIFLSELVQRSIAEAPRRDAG